MDNKEREQLAKVVADTVGSVLKLNSTSNGYVHRREYVPTISAIQDSVQEIGRAVEKTSKSVRSIAEDVQMQGRDIRGLGESMETQRKATDKLARVTNDHLLRHAVVKEEKEKAVQDSSHKLSRVKTWIWIGVVLIGMVGTLLTGAYMFGKMESRLLGKMSSGMVANNGR